MGDKDKYNYKLNSGQNQETLSLKKQNNKIVFSIEKSNGLKYSSMVSLPQLKDVSNAFRTLRTLKEALIILNDAIESGNIFLTEKEDVISLKIIIKKKTGNYPPFIINLTSDDSIPVKFDYKGNIEAEKKYGTSTENTTEYNNPIIQPDFKDPIVQLEYVEPIIQLHFPDGSTQSKVLPARIQKADGQLANINEEQFKYIQEQMNLHMNNQGKNETKYSMNTLPFISNTIDNSGLNNKRNNNLNKTKSKYSTYTVPSKPVVFSGQNMQSPEVFDQNQFQSSYATPTLASAQNGGSDIENLYKTETGLIIFRNGILKGIVQRYSEIDDIVTKIQDILLKGAKFKLIYRASTDGDNASTFHARCDNQKMTLVLVETIKGVRFGGFTTKTWGGYCKKKFDKRAFVFNIDNHKIYDIIDNQPAIGCYPKFGPAFMGCQIRIYDNCFIRGGTTCHRALNYNTDIDYELNNGERAFVVKDIEVYGVESVDV
jgi:hypothetical protein